MGGADAVGADEGDDAGEGVGEAVGIAEAGVEETLLADERAGGGEAQADGANRGGGVERFEMRVEGAEKDGGISLKKIAPAERKF